MTKSTKSPKEMLVTVPLSKVKPNPFRPVDAPYDEDLVNALMQDFSANGMWPNIVAREFKTAGKASENKLLLGYQTAYGHHRIEAARRMAIKTVNLIIKDMSDADMLRAMIAENSDEYKQRNVSRMMQDLEASVLFLKSNSDYVKAKLIDPFVKDPVERKRSLARFRANGPGKTLLSRMLGWPMSRTSDFLGFRALVPKKDLKKDTTLLQLAQDVEAARAAKRAEHPKAGPKIGRPALAGEKLEDKILKTTTELMELLERQPKKATTKNFWWTVEYNLTVGYELCTAKGHDLLEADDLIKAADQAKNLLRASRAAKKESKPRKAEYWHKEMVVKKKSVKKESKPRKKVAKKKVAKKPSGKRGMVKTK